MRTFIISIFLKYIQKRKNSISQKSIKQSFHRHLVFFVYTMRNVNTNLILKRFPLLSNFVFLKFYPKRGRKPTI